MSIAVKTIYKTTNWHDYTRALRQRGSLSVWVDPATVCWRPRLPDGRRQTYSDTALQVCRPIQVLFGMALGQTTGFVARLLNLAGSVPDFSTLSRRQKP